MSRWEFPDNYAIPFQAIRETYPHMQTATDGEVKRWYTDICNEVYDRCPVVVVDFTVPPWAYAKEDCLPAFEDWKYDR